MYEKKTFSSDIFFVSFWKLKLKTKHSLFVENSKTHYLFQQKNKQTFIRRKPYNIHLFLSIKDRFTCKDWFVQFALFWVLFTSLKQYLFCLFRCFVISMNTLETYHYKTNYKQNFHATLFVRHIEKAKYLQGVS